MTLYLSESENLIVYDRNKQRYTWYSSDYLEGWLPGETEGASDTDTVIDQLRHPTRHVSALPSRNGRHGAGALRRIDPGWVAAASHDVTDRWPLAPSRIRAACFAVSRSVRWMAPSGNAATRGSLPRSWR